MDANVKAALQSRPLRLAVNPFSPYFILNQETDAKEKFTGFCIDLINTMAQFLNFSYELVSPADGEWGVEHDGQWTGLVGLLQRQEADMAFLLSPSPERSTVAQWTVPMEFWYNNIVVRTHNDQSILWDSFLSPFHWSVYISLLASFICVCLLLHVTRVKRRESSEKTATGELVQFLYGSMLGRALSWVWTENAERVVIASWCILGVILTSCFTSKLTSLLVGVTPSPPFTSVREMLAHDEYRWGVLGGTKLVQILRESNSSSEQELYTRMMKFAEDDPDVLSHDYSVHLSKVLSENYAFFSDSPILDIWAAEHCELTVLPVKLTGLEYYSIMLPMDSIITGEINQLLLRLRDTGSLDFLSTQWFPPDTRCYGNRSPQRAFSLAMLQGPFYAAAAGLLLAAGVLCAERRGHRRFMS